MNSKKIKALLKLVNEIWQNLEQATSKLQVLEQEIEKAEK